MIWTFIESDEHKIKLKQASKRDKTLFIFSWTNFEFLAYCAMATFIYSVLYMCNEDTLHLKHQTLCQWDNYPINPATQRIILKIVGFLNKIWILSTFCHSHVYLQFVVPVQRRYSTSEIANFKGLYQECCLSLYSSFLEQNWNSIQNLNS